MTGKVNRRKNEQQQKSPERYPGLLLLLEITATAVVPPR
jgi:hypothetical protein